MNSLITGMTYGSVNGFNDIQRDKRDSCPTTQKKITTFARVFFSCLIPLAIVAGIAVFATGFFSPLIPIGVVVIAAVVAGMRLKLLESCGALTRL